MGLKDRRPRKALLPETASTVGGRDARPLTRLPLTGRCLTDLALSGPGQPVHPDGRPCTALRAIPLAAMVFFSQSQRSPNKASPMVQADTANTGQRVGSTPCPG